MTLRPRRRLAWLPGVVAILLGAVLMIASVVLAASSGTAVAQEEQTSDERTITVSGQGSVTATPDVARVDVGVEVTGDDLTEVFQNANEQMDEVIQALEEFGIPEDQIETTLFSINVERDPQARTTEITGYTVRNSAQVTVTNIDEVPELISTAVDAGANQVSNINFAIENREGLVAQARELAMENARERAMHLAELADVTLGEPVAIIETSAPVPGPRAVEEDAADLAAPPISPGQDEVTVGVSVTYSIE